MFASRLLMFAKTAVKETAPAKKKTPAAAAVVEKPKLQHRDLSKPLRPIHHTLFSLIAALPKVPANTPLDANTHKNGFGLKFYRRSWTKYPQPSFWTVTRFKPQTHGHHRKVWGVLTWRGSYTAHTVESANVI